ncbi:MAG: hypothetical protein GY868_20125, partial [Deltaproteobacteria bacterium]|nr:hypothetical protein [Deltaproteobacteria bacterium]
MNNKKIGALFVAFITLVVLYYILEHPAGDKKDKQLLPIVPGFDKGRAAAISISRPNHDTVKLKKQAQHWQVITESGTFSAENSAVTAMLDTVGSMQAASLVSRNPGNFASFDTDEDKGLKVIIIDN